MEHSAKTEITKSAMAVSLKKLITIKPMSRITIKDITDDCGLNRQTFYYHFKDIFDLFEWTFNREIEPIRQTVTSGSVSWEEVLYNFIIYLQDNKYICRCALDGIGREQIIQYLHNTASEIISNIVRQLHSWEEVPQKYLDFTVNFYTSAFGNYIFDWIKNGMNESPEEIIDLFRFIVERRIKAETD